MPDEKRGADYVRQLESRISTLEELLDVLERTVTEQSGRLERALALAQQAAQAKAAFLANMSHEIRTPLNGVMGMTGLLLDTTLTAEQRELAQMSLTSAEHLLGLINDILDFSKIDANKLAVEPIPFDLQTAVEEVGELLAPRADEKGIELILRSAPDVPDRIVGDPGRIRQVLLNLAGNAIKFTAAGHVLVDVKMEAKDEQRAVLAFSVEDSGIGISESSLAHIFDRFTQADASTTRKYGGTGLGLTISKQLVELMGGTMGVTSRVGQGSTFWFKIALPIAADLPTIGTPSPPVALGGVRVLVVDDNATNRRILHELIIRWGMRHGTASTGADALERMTRAAEDGVPYEIGILDYNMPEMDGIVLARAIKADPRIRETALILLTSSGRKGDAQRAAEAGFAAYLTKPVRPSVLMDALATTWAERGTKKAPALVTRYSLAEKFGRAPISPRSKAYAGVRVLLVEDNPVNQKVAVHLLEKFGCRVDIASDGKEAVAMVSALPYALVFMDCEMPEMDGYEATRTIRAQESAGLRLPIVAMTAHAMQGDRQKCLDAGMSDYIPKPVRPDALERALATWSGSPRAEEAP